jgi:perosamine synthetase
MRHGDVVSRYEAAFAERVGAKYAIATTNGTVSLEVALRAMDVGPGDTVQTTPLTMAATSIAILNVGATPQYHDVDEDTWLMQHNEGWATYLPVSLYGLHTPHLGSLSIDDAAQTLRPHSGAAFTSYSTQRSKIINTGEGGMLVTNHRHLATAARSIASLGYDMDPSQSRISTAALKSPTYDRHVRYPAMNARCNDVTAGRGLLMLSKADELLIVRQDCANLYRFAHARCPWITPQAEPLGYHNDFWTYAVACDTPERALWLADAMVKHGGERPYFAWRLTYQEPAFLNLVDNGALYPNIEWVGSITSPVTGYPANWAVNVCPVAESLQPRLLQFQTNNLESAERNATALRRAIQEAV